MDINQNVMNSDYRKTVVAGAIVLVKFLITIDISNVPTLSWQVIQPLQLCHVKVVKYDNTHSIMQWFLNITHT